MILIRFLHDFYMIDFSSPTIVIGDDVCLKVTIMVSVSSSNEQLTRLRLLFVCVFVSFSCLVRMFLSPTKHTESDSDCSVRRNGRVADS